MINRSKTIEFHFVANKILKQKLLIISKKLKLNLSKTVIYIIENMNPIIKKMQLIYKEENNKIEKINWDSHIHVYFNENNKKLYNKLKCIHKDINSYSIACKLRYLLNIFLKGIEMYGFSLFLKILSNAEKKWKDKIRFKKRWIKKRLVRQLSNYPLFNIIYDNNYTVYYLKFLN
ncbi:MAG: hypothetical protein JXB50_04660 [Spirochaetes bacterium]|nr:hypothetical protein [Spirochaetota bacterium]